MSAAGSVVGLIVNPGASRDIRRLTSLARTVDVHERVNQVARILQGLAAAADLAPGGIASVRYMHESCRVVERALDEITHAGLLGANEDGGANADVDASAGRGTGAQGRSRRARPPFAVEPVLGVGEPADDAAGTTRAASALARAGACCVVTVGGDGTNRAVVRGWPDAVLCAVPGGTNNALARLVDPAAAGFAAGLFAADPASGAAHARLHPRLAVRPGTSPARDAFEATFALVDVAVVRGAWVGAHAVWDPAGLVEAVVTRADPTVSGLAGLAGMIRPIDAGGPGGRAVHLRFSPLAGQGNVNATAGPLTVLAPLGPGQLVEVTVRSWLELAADQAVRLGPYPEPVTLAFDGEREIVVEPGGTVEVRLARSPLRLLDAAGLLRAMAAEGALILPRDRR